MKEEDRPEEIHLCAPAISEVEYGQILSTAAREKLVLYYNPDDAVLKFCFPAMEFCESMGCVGPKDRSVLTLAKDMVSFWSRWTLAL